MSTTWNAPSGATEARWGPTGGRLVVRRHATGLKTRGGARDQPRAPAPDVRGPRGRVARGDVPVVPRHPDPPGRGGDGRRPAPRAAGRRPRDPVHERRRPVPARTGRSARGPARAPPEIGRASWRG